MRALQLTGPRKLELIDIPQPVPDGNLVLIRVSACGICGSDLHYWEYGIGLDGRPGLIMGHEFCGTVIERGSRTDLTPGDRVTALPLDPCDACEPCLAGHPNLCLDALHRRIPGNNSPGAFAEFLALRPDMVRKLPDGLSDRTGALIEPAAVGLHAVHQGGVRACDSVLIVGGGTIGRMAAKWARLEGASFIALAEINSTRRDQALADGDADAVYDPLEKGALRSMKERSSGGFDVVIETSAADGGANLAIKALRWRGRMVFAGIAMNPQKLVTVNQVLKEITIAGAMGYAPGEFDHALETLAAGRINAEGLIRRTIRLEDCQNVFEELISGQTNAVKIVVTP